MKKLLIVLPLAACATNESQVNLASYTSLDTMTAALAEAVPAQDATSSGVESRATLYIGSRNLDDADWYPVDQQLALGIEYSRETAGAPLGFEVGFTYSSDDTSVAAIGIDGETMELYGGGRKTWLPDEVWHPYAGFGLAWLRGEQSVGPFSADDNTIGLYIHGGILFDLNQSFSLGFDIRQMFATSLDLGFDADANYRQYALTVGFGF